MTRVIYHTASTLDGYLADPNDSLDWLFSVPGSPDAEASMAAFLESTGAMVMGSTTYAWMWEHELRDNPGGWAQLTGDRAVFVFTTRVLPRPPASVNLTFLSGSVSTSWAQIVEGCDGKDVWLVGGGDLVGQFAEAGHLDELRVTVAPVTLGAGRPLLPRRFESDRLGLESVERVGQFAELRYSFR